MKRMLAILLAACALALGAASLAEAAPQAEETVSTDDAAVSTDGAIAAEAAPQDGEDAEAKADEAEGAADAALADAESAEPEPVRVWFEEGFGLDIPQGWASYPVSEADRAAGVRYALGDSTGGRWLYVRAQPTRLEDVGALSELIARSESLEQTGELTFGDTPFVAFIDAAQNVSGCATLWGGEIVVFLFTPQSDSAFMMAATEVMESFTAQ